MNPRVQAALAAWREMAQAPIPADRVAAARARMHAAAAAVPRRGLLGSLIVAIALHRRPTALAGAAAAVALVGFGWDAPAGSVLHDVRVAREDAALLVPGLDHTAMRLSYAEARLSDAEVGRGDRTASLREAGSILADVRSGLAPSQGGPDRLSRDESRLSGLLAAPSAPGGEEPGAAPTVSPSASGSPSAPPSPSPSPGISSSPDESPPSEGSFSPRATPSGRPSPSPSRSPSPRPSPSPSAEEETGARPTPQPTLTASAPPPTPDGAGVGAGNGTGDAGGQAARPATAAGTAGGGHPSADARQSADDRAGDHDRRKPGGASDS